MGGGGSAGGGGRSLRSVLIQDATICFTTIAVLLGTGILGLPIKLVETGFGPFVLIFTVTLLMQLAIVWVHADTLQRAQKHMQARIALEKGALSLSEVTAPQVDLHTMGRLYLSPLGSYVFDAAVLLTFVSTLISYSLAGANAFSQLLGVSVDDLIIPFTGICTFLIVFASGIVRPIISVLTFFKVILLTFIIGTCGVVATKVNVPFHSSWSDVLSPFLVGTVAIGGIADMMPVFFTYRNPTARDVSHFRWSIAAGIIICYILNIVWARAVLGIVPQSEADAVADGSTVSLQKAGADGDIATKPVIQVIDSSYPQYHWVALIVTAFITLSISVSYNAVGLGIKHVLDGMAVTVMRGLQSSLGLSPADMAAMEEMSGGADPHGFGGEAEVLVDHTAMDQSVIVINRPHGSVGQWIAALNPARLVAAVSAACSSRAIRLLLTARGVLYVLCFGCILGVALADPSGFINVLEIFTSMALNTAGGVMVVLMYVGVRRPPAGSLHRKAMDGEDGEAGGERSRSSSIASVEKALMQPDGSYHGDESGGSGNREELDDEADRGEGRFSAHAIMLDAVSSVDPGIPAPLPEVLGSLLAFFCLVTFSMAVVYDMYNSGVSQGVYGQPVGAWIGIAGGTLIWRAAGLPTLRYVIEAMKAGGKTSEPQQVGHHHHHHHSGGHSGFGSVLLSPSMSEAWIDLVASLSCAWASSKASAVDPASAAIAGSLLILHAADAFQGFLASKLGGGMAAIASDVVSALALGALAAVSGLRGYVGPSLLQGVAALLVATLCVTRTCLLRQARRRQHR